MNDTTPLLPLLSQLLSFDTFPSHLDYLQLGTLDARHFHRYYPLGNVKLLHLDRPSGIS